jgi:prepilin-type N-terminal cleavage/methylation domain-containing protein
MSGFYDRQDIVSSANLPLMTPFCRKVMAIPFREKCLGKSPNGRKVGLDHSLSCPCSRVVLPYKRSPSPGKAFTLVEMLITLCILGLLAAISVPIYVKYMERARQADAKAQLLVIRQDQELYRLQNGTYAGQALRASLSGWREAVGKYSFSITGATASEFTALASGDLDGDGTSDVWTINQHGALINTQSDL